MYAIFVEFFLAKLGVHVEARVWVEGIYFNKWEADERSARLNDGRTGDAPKYSAKRIG